MALWLKLTWYDGTPLRLNMDKQETYQPCEENGANTSITMNGEAYQVRETMTEIDNAISNLASPLRVIQAVKGWT